MGISQPIIYSYVFICCDYDPRNVVLKPIFRNKAGNRIYCEVDDFEPYLYIPKEDIDLIPMDDHRIVRIEHGDFIYKHFESINEIYEIEMIKVFVKRPEHVPQIRGLFDQTGEADVLFRKRFLIDTNIWVYGLVRKPLNPHEINHLSWTEFLSGDEPYIGDFIIETP